MKTFNSYLNERNLIKSLVDKLKKNKRVIDMIKHKSSMTATKLGAALLTIPIVKSTLTSADSIQKASMLATSLKSVLLGEARTDLVKGWTLKGKMVSVTTDYGNYHIMQVTNKPSKFGLNEKKLLKILEDWYDDMSAPDHKREARIMLRKLKDGREIDNSPPIEEYLMKKGYCRFTIDKTHGSIEGQTEKECREGAKVLDDNYLPYERSGFKLFEVKPLRGRPKHITNKFDWYSWLGGKKSAGKRTSIGSTMAQFREWIARNHK